MKPLEELLRPNIRGFKAYTSARDEFKETSTDYVFLDANENPFNTSVNRYPDPYQEKLKHKLSKLKKVAPSQILIGNGSDEVLDLLFRAFCNPGKDAVISLPPTYGMYNVLANLNDIEITEVLLTEDFQLNVPAILEAVNEQTKLLFLCSPNNPTGNTFTKKGMVELLEKFPGIVVLDEAYIDFSNNKSWIRNLEKFPNLVITQTMSKAYGMAGIRLGICYASEKIIAVLNSIKPPYNVNALSQKRAVKRLRNLSEVKEEIAEIKSSRETLKNELEELTVVEKVYPSEANFILVKVTDADKIYKQLKEKKIIVRNRTTQPLCENTLRLTVGTKTENKLLLQALKEIE